ncbi:hypothetical protein [Sinorhizobium saheli]|uniref:Uncharacterized protein n=1 Tax=Sinorhizobium saheli TaxID=36856 RepID=A0A178XYK1_SINSA|nr:hypothetical protein [Sinorhizobium saheli]MQW90137.1 hypothetical protein [Sinorhizobium saheli]OAP40266.1 hypothetical protein ATB98_02170 [Sinorhizobium saheli]
MHAGKGGSYIRNPEDGSLRLVQRTEEAKAEKPASDGASSSPVAEAERAAASADNSAAKTSRKK